MTDLTCQINSTQNCHDTSLSSFYLNKPIPAPSRDHEVSISKAQKFLANLGDVHPKKHPYFFQKEIGETSYAGRVVPVEGNKSEVVKKLKKELELSISEYETCLSKDPKKQCQTIDQIVYLGIKIQKIVVRLQKLNIKIDSAPDYIKDLDQLSKAPGLGTKQKNKIRYILAFQKSRCPDFIKLKPTRLIRPVNREGDQYLLGEFFLVAYQSLVNRVGLSRAEATLRQVYREKNGDILQTAFAISDSQRMSSHHFQERHDQRPLLTRPKKAKRLRGMNRILKSSRPKFR